eukprot:CAMPEP_0177649370 /NCGR_PEP_ID=MMETSP0447-20121125/11347_1 /TAXON_ID=0 /ORGANISM="Stygamoeba regulata, Strain BSH-02190019" /LENGTH=122 /DNA_ID=CAMNT_0019152117 /DNA_START=258 /DNA_END=626 /DNA_ORIENTATION=+
MSSFDVRIRGIVAPILQRRLCLAAPWCTFAGAKEGGQARLSRWIFNIGRRIFNVDRELFNVGLRDVIVVVFSKPLAHLIVSGLRVLLNDIEEGFHDMVSVLGEQQIISEPLVSLVGITNEAS